MIAPPMPGPSYAARPGRLTLPLLSALLAGCASYGVAGAPPSLGAPAASATPLATPRPSPTPSPTPTYTNLPDAELRAAIPSTVRGVAVAQADEIALTPGDVGEVFGDIGRRFRSLAIAYTDPPRLTLFAMRMDPPRATTPQLRPHLPEIGRYVGIAELDPAAWKLETVAGRRVWVRGEDEATLPGTRVYTWIAGDLVFLLIGTDEAHNAAMIAALPEEP